ncbi:hypothetical protein BO70DRAFT_355993 [Aspergillus heteromorphus CBS 117.55]|uniref:Uncharacterized protein n=1 Tax=Aspergillus heteromorphus CBS 117.55 TaxID=1448321 RepID=A0A317V7T5_9EURO|nr:uncharacterized protein BO70DRAFT_355993 [Aspergillus heteromorphus CBS 117.55]PWY69108.1 hypothetical protein BO70DRAFT_355993 [Aspergillus heteromorphus CBS 117.55]
MTNGLTAEDWKKVVHYYYPSSAGFTVSVRDSHPHEEGVITEFRVSYRDGSQPFTLLYLDSLQSALRQPLFTPRFREMKPTVPGGNEGRFDVLGMAASSSSMRPYIDMKYRTANGEVEISATRLRGDPEVGEFRALEEVISHNLRKLGVMIEQPWYPRDLPDSVRLRMILGEDQPVADPSNAPPAAHGEAMEMHPTPHATDNQQATVRRRRNRPQDQEHDDDKSCRRSFTTHAFYVSPASHYPISFSITPT